MSELVEFEIAQQADISRASVCAHARMRAHGRTHARTHARTHTASCRGDMAITTEESRWLLGLFATLLHLSNVSFDDGKDGNAKTAQLETPLATDAVSGGIGRK